MNADVARRNPYRIPGSAALTQATETVTGYYRSILGILETDIDQ